MDTIGTSVSGSISFDPDSFVSEFASGLGLSDGDFVPTPSTTSSAHVVVGSFDAVSTVAFVEIEDWDPNNNTGSSNIQDTWRAPSGFLFNQSHTNAYFMELSLQDQTLTRITSSEFFIPMTLDGFTRAAVDFYYLPVRGPALLVSSAPITQWSVVGAPEPESLALLGVVVVGLLLRATGIRNA